jgi:hypothetical protein
MHEAATATGRRWRPERKIAMTRLPLEITAVALATALSLLTLLLPGTARGGVRDWRAPDADTALLIADQGNRALLEIRHDAARLQAPALPAYTAAATTR